MTCLKGFESQVQALPMSSSILYKSRHTPLRGLPMLTSCC